MIKGKPTPLRNLTCQKVKINKILREEEEGSESLRPSEGEIREGQRIITNAKKHCRLMNQALLKLMSSTQEIGQLQGQVKAMESAFWGLSVNNEMQFNSLQNSLMKLKEEKEMLQVRLDDLECTSTEQQARLKATVDEQREVIRTLNLDLAESKQEIKNLHFQVEENKSFAQEYRRLMKEIERKQRIKNNKNVHPQVRKLICHNTVLREKVEQSTNIINAQKAHCKDLQLQSLQLQTYIRRFEEELQACMSVITEPKQLKQKLTVLKRNYIDNPKMEQNLENFEREHQTIIGNLQKRLERLARIMKNNKNTRKQLEQKLSEAVSTFSKKESEYIKLLKVEIHKTKQMERELKKANVKADTAYKTMKENSAKSTCSSVTTQLDEETEFSKLHCGLSELSDTGNADSGNRESDTSHHICGTSLSEDSVGDEV